MSIPILHVPPLFCESETALERLLRVLVVYRSVILQYLQCALCRCNERLELS